MISYKNIPPMFLTLLVFFMVFVIYCQGISGGLFYDDLSNLAGLQDVNGWSDILSFAQAGDAGPLGRPLSLITFTLHAGDWPESLPDALLFNVILHVINAALLLGIGYLVLNKSGHANSRDAYIAALLASALWISMPLLASTTLIAIQRMTGLSSMLGLFGIYLYLYIRQDSETWSRFLVKLGVLFGFVGVGLLAKESVAIFPIYVLVIEFLVFRKAPWSAQRKAAITVLCIYSAAIAAYLFFLIPSDVYGVDAYRGFSLIERLQTQPVILMEYLKLALVPSLNEYGPFHDDTVIVRKFDAIVLSFIFWLVIFAFGWVLRNRNIFILFAVMWFFVGHIIESTVVMLELYFEHRNYIAVYGFCLFFGSLFLNLKLEFRAYFFWVFGAYVSSQLTVLLLLTNIWGKPLEAAAHWVDTHPASSRAIMSLSAIYYKETSSSGLAGAVLEQGIENCPKCLDVAMQSLVFSCLDEDESKVRRRYNRVLNVLPDGNFTPAFLDGIYPIREFLKEGQCEGIEFSDVLRLLERAKENPRFIAEQNNIHRLYLSAVIASDMGDYEKSMALLDEVDSNRRILNAVTLRAQIISIVYNREAGVDYLESQKSNFDNIGPVSDQEWEKALESHLLYN